jgi:hypothetical protein
VTGNYNNVGNTTITDAIAKADAVVTVTPYSGLYDGVTHGAAGTATGVGTPATDLTTLLNLGATFTNVPGGTAHWVFTGTTNYNRAEGDVAVTISKAPSVTTLTCAADSFVYTGSAQTPCTASVTAVGGLSESLTVTYSSNTYPGTAAASASYPGDTNHAVSTDSKSFTIGYGVCGASVGAGGVILPPINSDGTSVYQRKGGSTIPVKFRVCDAAGNSISNSAAVFAETGGSLSMLSAVRGYVTTVNEAGASEIPDVAFRWDASSRQWIYNMATSNLTSGNSYTFRINLAAGGIQFGIGVK